MKTIDIPPGMSITQAAKLLIAAGEASCDFNGIRLESRPSMTAQDIVTFYNAESDRRAEEYHRSPEGKAFEARSRAEVKELQAQADRLMRRLPSLDFSNLSELLKWLSGIEEARDRVGVRVDTGQIIEAFTSHGYEPDANCYEKFDKNDCENYARWVIGQAIKEPYYPAIRRFAEEWRKKFSKEAA